MDTMTTTTTKGAKKAEKVAKVKPVVEKKAEPKVTEKAEVIDLKAAKEAKAAEAKLARQEAKAKAELLRQETKGKKDALNEELKSLRVKAMAVAREQIKALSARSCACGCGAATKNTFAPGHDAQLHSRILREKFIEGLKAEGLYEIAIELKLVEV